MLRFAWFGGNEKLKVMNASKQAKNHTQVRHRSLVRRKIKLKGGRRLKRESRFYLIIFTIIIMIIIIFIKIIMINCEGKCVRLLVTKKSVLLQELPGQSRKNTSLS